MSRLSLFHADGARTAKSWEEACIVALCRFNLMPFPLVRNVFCSSPKLTAEQSTRSCIAFYANTMSASCRRRSCDSVSNIGLAIYSYICIVYNNSVMYCTFFFLFYLWLCRVGTTSTLHLLLIKKFYYYYYYYVVRHPVHIFSWFQKQEWNQFNELSSN